MRVRPKPSVPCLCLVDLLGEVLSPSCLATLYCAHLVCCFRGCAAAHLPVWCNPGLHKHPDGAPALSAREQVCGVVWCGCATPKAKQNVLPVVASIADEVHYVTKKGDEHMCSCLSNSLHKNAALRGTPSKPEDFKAGALTGMQRIVRGSHYTPAPPGWCNKSRIALQLILNVSDTIIVALGWKMFKRCVTPIRA